ncbi:large ribosomal subunit protein mL62 isoform X1 [Elgaria multicarinata webbii]|uniref:large ribosomal subunit protein mL62 isoform X1 n=1 Tax=Elgaria multicarinata webbii TaxID=159646 RepID=UPI002FCD0520
MQPAHLKMAASALRWLWRTPLYRLLPSEAPGRFLGRAVASAPPVYNSEFRSEYSLDKLYPSSQKGTDTTKLLEGFPESDDPHLNKPSHMGSNTMVISPHWPCSDAKPRWDRANQTAADIPIARLSISYSRSSGPGGQNVNKVNTKAEVRFHLSSADWIAEDVRQKMAVMHRNKVNRAGELIVTSEMSRYQMRNLADCLQKIRDMIAEATAKPQVHSIETVEMIRERVEKMNRERLRQKKQHSSLKQSRRMDFD